MKIRLIRDARIHHRAGEIIDVSPAEAVYLTSVRSAEMVLDATAAPEAAPEPKTAKKTAKKAGK